MNELQYLFAGFTVFWAGLTVYLVWLQIRLRTVKRELDRLEERLGDEEEQRASPAGRTAGDSTLQARPAPPLAVDPRAHEAP